MPHTASCRWRAFAMSEELPPIPLAPDDFWAALGNVRRRRVILIVDESDDWLHLKEVSQRVAAYETHLEVDEVDETQWRSVYSSLVNHCMRLSDADLVNYWHEGRDVASVSRTEPVAKWIRAVHAACELDDHYPIPNSETREGGI